MASRRKGTKAVPFNATDIANFARSNPYIQQLVNDPKLRKQVQTAIRSSKSAYSRLNHGKVSARGVLEDKKLHQDLGRALGATRDVTIIVVNTKRKRARKRMSFGRTILLIGIGAALALAGSEQLRSKVLDLLFGAEEEFQYTPPPNAGAPEATTTVGAA
jgi:hypothetical protein